MFTKLLNTIEQKIYKMFEHIKDRLIKLVEDRNYTFIETSKEDAEAYLDKFRLFEGLSENEVTNIEKELNFSFPDDFRTYLKTFGKKGGLLFEAGSDLNPGELVNYQTYGKNLMEPIQRGKFFKDDTIVFYMHQGYSFCCFHKDFSDKYSIYYYCEGEPEPLKIYNSFTQMLEKEIDIIEKRHEEIKSMGGYFIKVREGVEKHIIPQNSMKSPKEAEDQFID